MKNATPENLVISRYFPHFPALVCFAFSGK